MSVRHRGPFRVRRGPDVLGVALGSVGVIAVALLVAVLLRGLG